MIAMIAVWRKKIRLLKLLKMRLQSCYCLTTTWVNQMQDIMDSFGLDDDYDSGSERENGPRGGRALSTYHNFFFQSSDASKELVWIGIIIGDGTAVLLRCMLTSTWILIDGL